MTENKMVAKVDSIKKNPNKYGGSIWLCACAVAALIVRKRMQETAFIFERAA